MNKVLRATLVSAVVITTVIGIASFVLSFAALWDLATMAGVPRNLSWLWPVIVDGTILQATISVIALAQFDQQSSGRRFFWAVLVIAALVSIGANALHAFISQTGTLHPALSAAIATVAPVSLLAATHGLGILVRIPAVHPAERPEPDPGRGLDVHENRSTTNTAAVQKPLEAAPALEPAATPTPVAEPAYTATPAATASLPATNSPPATNSSTVSMADLAEMRDPLADVDRWILDDDRAEDLFPVDAP